MEGFKVKDNLIELLVTKVKESLVIQQLIIGGPIAHRPINSKTVGGQINSKTELVKMRKSVLESLALSREWVL